MGSQGESPLETMNSPKALTPYFLLKKAIVPPDSGRYQIVAMI
jgi:hypothetical protein